MIFNLVNSNLQNSHHRFLLTKCSVANRASGRFESQPDQLKASSAAIDGAAQYLELEQKLRPLTILGVPATISAMSTAGAALALIAPLISPHVQEVIRVHFSASGAP